MILLEGLAVGAFVAAVFVCIFPVAGQRVATWIDTVVWR